MVDYGALLIKRYHALRHAASDARCGQIHMDFLERWAKDVKSLLLVLVRYPTFTEFIYFDFGLRFSQKAGEAWQTPARKAV